jgi:chromate reductase
LALYILFLKIKELLMKTLIVSTSKGNNYKLAKEIGEFVAKQNVSYEVISLEDYPMPVYTSAEDAKGVPEVAKELSKKIKEAERLIFCFPEYNGTIPPIFNNSLAWVSRTSPDWRDGFNGKLGIVATHSAGPGLKALLAGRTMLEHLGMFIHPRMIQKMGDNPLKLESMSDILGRFYGWKN